MNLMAIVQLNVSQGRFMENEKTLTDGKHP